MEINALKTQYLKDPHFGLLWFTLFHIYQLEFNLVQLLSSDHCVSYISSPTCYIPLTIGLRSCQDNLGYNWIFRHQTFRSTRVHQAKQKNEGRRQTYNSQPQKNSGRRRCAYVAFFSQLCREVQLYSSKNKVGKIMEL